MTDNENPSLDELLQVVADVDLTNLVERAAAEIIRLRQQLASIERETIERCAQAAVGPAYGEPNPQTGEEQYRGTARADAASAVRALPLLHKGG